MAERLVDSRALEAEALGIVQRLKNVAETQTRVYPSSIEAVWVFSGPGTYFDKLKPNQTGEYRRWMDRDRIRAGVAVVSEVTAARKYEVEGATVEITETDPITKAKTSKTIPIRGGDITKDDIRKYGPLFVYNGTEFENQEIRRALQSPFCKLPKEKVLLIDEVREPNSVFAIRHTGDQYESFFQEMANPFSPLHGVDEVALVAHIPDFIRHPFYAEKYNQQQLAPGGEPITFWAYALRSRIGAEQPHTESELKGLVTYAQKGDLATEASPFRT